MMMTHEPHPEFVRFKQRWDRAERWWPVFKRGSRLGNWMLGLATFGCLLEMVFVPDDVLSTGYRWLVLPTMGLGAVVSVVGIIAGEWVIRDQGRALDEWKPTGCPPSCPCRRGF